jgi:O-antigen/teichoic acid export membrane protein
MDSVARGTLTNLGSRVAAVLAVLALTTFAARQGPEVQGAFALFTSVEGLVLALGSGFGVWLARQVSVAGWPAAGAAGAAARSALAAQAGFVVAGCISLGTLAIPALLLLGAFGGPGYAEVGRLVLVAPVLLLAPNLAGLWLGASRMAPMAVLSLAAPLFTLAVVGVAVVALGVALNVPLTPPLALALLLSAWVAGRALAGALAWGMARGDLGAGFRAGFGFGPTEAVRAAGVFVLAIAGTAVIGLLNYRAGLFVVERVQGLAAAGLYSIAIVVAEALWFVSSALTQAAYGRIGQPDAAAAAAVTLRAMQLSVVALLAAAPFLLALAWAIVPALLGPAYAASLPPLAVLLPGVVLYGAASSLSAWFTNHAGQPGVPARVALGCLVLNLALAALLVPRFGLTGAALAATLAYAASVAWLGVRFARAAGWPVAALLRPGPQLGADLRSIASRVARRR